MNAIRTDDLDLRYRCKVLPTELSSQLETNQTLILLYLIRPLAVLDGQNEQEYASLAAFDCKPILNANSGFLSHWEDEWMFLKRQVGQESNTSSLTCLCNHLTTFGGGILVPPNTIDFEVVQQAFGNLDPGDLLVLITVCSAFLVYFAVLVIARRADNKDVLKVCINNLYNGIASSSLDNFRII